MDTPQRAAAISKEAFDELVQQRHTSTRTARLAIVLALVAFAYGLSLLVIVALHLR